MFWKIKITSYIFLSICVCIGAGAGCVEYRNRPTLQSRQAWKEQRQAHQEWSAERSERHDARVLEDMTRLRGLVSRQQWDEAEPLAIRLFYAAQDDSLRREAASTAFTAHSNLPDCPTALPAALLTFLGK